MRMSHVRLTAHSYSRRNDGREKSLALYCREAQSKSHWQRQFHSSHLQLARRGQPDECFVTSVAGRERIMIWKTID